MTTTIEELQEQLDALKLAYSEMTAEKLSLIQNQLASLETSYANFARTYFNMFYSTTPMDITLSIYQEDGTLTEVTVPNRAKSYQQAQSGSGEPNGSVTGPLGSLYIDTASSGTLWYKTTSDGSSAGWCKVYTTANWGQNQEYLAPDGDGSLLKNLNATNIATGVLSIAHGGTGVENFTKSGGYAEGGSLLAVVPESYDENNETIPAYLRPAVAGEDYLAAQNLAGMIMYFPCQKAPAGYLACDGSMLKKASYPELYEVLSSVVTDAEGNTSTNFPDVEITIAERVNFPDGDWDDYFKIPNLSGVTIRCLSFSAEDEQPGQYGRAVYTYEKGGVPNIKGTWAQEITGAEASFTGSIQIAKENGEPVQVDGKTSAPAGAYDYRIDFDASNSSDVYDDDLTEVRVNNINLLPAIKY